MHFGMRVVGTKQSGTTGRVVCGGEAHTRAVVWSKQPTIHEMRTDPTFTDFVDLVKQSPLATELACIRGQYIETPPPSRDRMGPLPADHAYFTSGRYSVRGCRVFYLASTEEGVRLELAAWVRPGEVWLQRFTIPVTLRIADFSQTPEDHLLTSAFSIAEDCMLDEQGGLPTYDFSNLLASVVAEHFDGMLVPGVRGQRGKQRYRNVVIFRYHDDWRDWLDGDPSKDVVS